MFYYFSFINEEPYLRHMFTRVLNVSFVCVALLPTFFQVMGYGELYLYGIRGYMGEAAGVHE